VRKWGKGVLRVAEFSKKEASAEAISCSDTANEIYEAQTQPHPLKQKSDPMNQTAISESADNLVGLALLNDPARNKGTAFTEDERQRFGLEGLLPPSAESLDRPVERVLRRLEAKPTDLERYIYLIGLSDRNETLFYRTVSILEDAP
jgi:hypothetical protein